MSPSLQIASQSVAPRAHRTSAPRPTRAKIRGRKLTPPGLLRRGGARELDVLDAERIERLGDGNLGLGVEEGVGELLALCVP